MSPALEIYARYKPQEAEYGPGFGGTQVLLLNLEQHPQIQVTYVTPKNFPSLSQHPAGLDGHSAIIIQRPKHKYWRDPCTQLLHTTLRNDNSSLRLADFWSDNPVRQDEDLRWVAAYLSLASRIPHLVSSPLIAHDLHTHFGVPLDQTHFIPSQINPLFLETNPQPNVNERSRLFDHATSQDLVIVSHERICPESNQLNLICLATWLKAASNQLPEDRRIIFAIFGNHQITNYGQLLVKAARDQGLLEDHAQIRFIFFGPTPNHTLPAILTHADAAISLAQEPPILSQTWGLTPAEDFALGLHLLSWAHNDNIQKPGSRAQGTFYPFSPDFPDDLYQQLTRQIITLAQTPPNQRLAQRLQASNLARTIYRPDQSASAIFQVFNHQT